MSISTPTVHVQRDRDGLAVLGRTKHSLMGIRYAEGEGGDEGGGDAAAQEAAAAAKPPWGDDPSKFDPDKAWSLIENLRKDADTRQTKTDAAIAAAAEKSQKDTLAQFAKLLTGEGEPETDPAKLNETITAMKTREAERETEATTTQQAAKTSALSLQVAIHSPSLGGNAALLLANEKFTTSIGAVDPTDEAAVKAAITQALQDNAALKATPARSGSGEHQGATVQSLQAQLTKAEEAKDFRETIRLKRAIVAAKA